MNLSEYIDLLRGQGRADKTVVEYTKHLRRFLVWCDTLGLDPASIAPHHVRTYADGNIRNSWATRKQARTALAHYWRGCGRDDEPWAAIRVPRKPRPGYTGLNPEQAAILKAAAVMVGGRPGLATLCCLYTGARASEVAGLHHDHIGDGVIRWWRTKSGGDWQVMPLHPTLAAELGEGTGWVFTGNNGRDHVSGATVWSWVRKVSATVSMEVSPKQLRSTAGKLVLDATGNLDAAATFLGHRDVNVTRDHYVETSASWMGAAVRGLDALG